jgi:hypothetical protein
MAVQIQLRNDIAANWSSADPILAIGEMGLETDTDKFKIGNGVDTWSELPYGGIEGPAGADSTVPGPQGEAGPQGEIGEPGVVDATSPIEYDSLTQTVSLNYDELVIDGGTA